MAGASREGHHSGWSRTLSATMSRIWPIGLSRWGSTLPVTDVSFVAPHVARTVVQPRHEHGREHADGILLRRTGLLHARVVVDLDADVQRVAVTGRHRT